jgi:hypothetical protein
MSIITAKDIAIKFEIVLRIEIVTVFGSVVFTLTLRK